MASAAVSQEPAVPHATAAASADLEAGLATPHDQGEDSPPVEIEAEQDDAGRFSSTWRFLNDRRRLSDFPFFGLGFAAAVSLVFIISDLMNKHTFHPISAGVFLLSASYCIAIIRREWSGDEGAEGVAGISRQPGGGVLTKEARESLLTYFVFEAPTVEGAAAEVVAAGSVKGKTDQPQPQEEKEQEKGQAEGKELPSSASTGILQDLSSSSRGGSSGGGREWLRENGLRKRGQEIGGADSSGSCGSKRDDRIDTADTDSLPVSTPAASPGPSPGPSSPVPVVVPLEKQPHLEGGDGGGDGGGNDGGGDAADSAAAAVVSRTGLDQLDGEDQKEGEAQREREVGSAPFDRLDVDVAIEAATATTRTALGDDAGKRLPDTTAETGQPEEEEEEEEEAVAAATAASAPAAGGVMKGFSDSGEWSTDQSCIVCFGDYCAGDLLCRLPCRHVYHAKCIDEWLDRARLPCCPLCKTDLLASSPDDGNGNGNGTGTGTTASGSGHGGGAAAAGAGAGGIAGALGLVGDNAV